MGDSLTLITLVGVGHVFDIGSSVKSIIFQSRPAAVCLELDEERLVGLMMRERGSSHSMVYRSLGDFQSKIAKRYGTTVGSEMLAAHEAASLLGIPVYCIDMNASEFFNKAFRSMSLREKIYLALNSITARFAGRRKIEGEIEQFQENDAEYINEFGKRFPTLKRVLIDERNAFMASKLREIAAEKIDVVAVIGDGHVDGVRKLIADLPVKVIRLKELRAMQDGTRSEGISGNKGNSEVSFSFSYR
ncbi:MAG: TraB/GumN family protein [Candidatus Thermoplasmatota archaeon]|nr:TraB/GumN family protein [Candidatus Thermoplasmatota archaeon]